jgi:hypothetical protein
MAQEVPKIKNWHSPRERDRNESIQPQIEMDRCHRGTDVVRQPNSVQHVLHVRQLHPWHVHRYVVFFKRVESYFLFTVL